LLASLRSLLIFHSQDLVFGCCSVLTHADFRLHLSFRSTFSFCAPARVSVRSQSRAARSPSSAVAIFPCARRSPAQHRDLLRHIFWSPVLWSMSCAPDSFSLRVVFELVCCLLFASHAQCFCLVLCCNQGYVLHSWILFSSKDSPAARFHYWVEAVLSSH
jgi:hypothetical protein